MIIDEWLDLTKQLIRQAVDEEQWGIAGTLGNAVALVLADIDQPDQPAPTPLDAAATAYAGLQLVRGHIPQFYPPATEPGAPAIPARLSVALEQLEQSPAEPGDILTEHHHHNAQGRMVSGCVFCPPTNPIHE